LVLYKDGEKYVLRDQFSEAESVDSGFLVGEYDDLESALRAAQGYMNENVVEYGLRTAL
jgi:hypothetical protein